MAYRLFVGLSPPEETADALASLMGGLPGARWRPVETLHLTLAFLGETDRRGFEDVAAALSFVSAPSFTLRFTEFGVFGAEGRPRALWAGVARDPALDLLQGRVVQAAKSAGVPPDARKFTPHVTLAYLRGARDDETAAWCAERSLAGAPEFPAGEFHLYRSYLGGEASRYEIEESYLLHR